MKALSSAKTEARVAVGNACLICTLKLIQQNETDKAVALCNAMQTVELPQHIKLAATRNAIAALGEDGLPRLAELLESKEESQFRVALHVARQLGDDVDVSSALVAGFKKQSPSRQALLLIALGDLGDKIALPTVVEAAKVSE